MSSSNMPAKLSSQKQRALLLKSMELLQVELQGLQFLLGQEIIMEQFETSVISFEVESLTKEIRLLGTTREKNR